MMNYVDRGLKEKFLRMSSFFKAVLITGARQIGKTTLLLRLAADTARIYVTLDDTQALELAKADPVLFFKTYRPPIIIDEVQRAPELFLQIKLLCDQSDENGRFWLTGSQQFEIFKNVRESLAGRLCVLQMFSLSYRELCGGLLTEELDFSFDSMKKHEQKAKQLDVPTLYEHIWRGGMPQIAAADAEQRQEYFFAYVNTYLMRDVVEFGKVTDIIRFRRFVTAAAALCAEQINYKKLAETAEISAPTAKEWLSLLQTMGIVYLLQPYSNNLLKRLTKTPKLYFFDTGLCAFLANWPTPQTLASGAVSGHYFENYVIAELLKNSTFSKTHTEYFYYRDANKKEIDLIALREGVLHPFEIKKAATPDRREVKKFATLREISANVGVGGIICMCDKVMPIDESNYFIPCRIL